MGIAPTTTITAAITGQDLYFEVPDSASAAVGANTVDVAARVEVPPVSPAPASRPESAAVPVVTMRRSSRTGSRTENWSEPNHRARERAGDAGDTLDPGDDELAEFVDRLALGTDGDVVRPAGI